MILSLSQSFFLCFLVLDRVSGDQKDIHLLEMKRVFDNALEIIKDENREARINEVAGRVEVEKTSKICPSCKKHFDKSQRKCPSCNTFYKKFLTENPTTDDDTKCESSWSTRIYYEHIDDHHPPGLHTLQVLDPVLTNPNNKRDILAITRQLKEQAKISISEHDSKRSWCYVSADAAISVQVSYIKVKTTLSLI